MTSKKQNMVRVYYFDMHLDVKNLQFNGTKVWRQTSKMENNEILIINTIKSLIELTLGILVGDSKTSE